jgi:CHAT domain-containing protein/tetratricopeptide (TPR) repeat protein
MKTLIRGVAKTCFIAFISLAILDGHAQEADFYLPIETKSREACARGSFKDALEILDPTSEVFRTQAKKFDRIKLSRSAHSCAYLALSGDEAHIAFSLSDMSIRIIEFQDDIDAGTLAQALDLHGQILSRLGKTNEARAAHAKSVDLFEKNYPNEIGRVAALYNFTLTLMKLQEYKVVLEQVNLALALSEKLGKPAARYSFDLWLSSLIASLNLNEPSHIAESLKNLSSLSSQPDQSVNLLATRNYLLAHALLSGNKASGALKHFQTALSLNESSSSPDHEMAKNIILAINSIAADLGMAGLQKEQALKRVVRAKEVNSDPRETADALWDYSNILWNEGDIVGASEIAKEVASLLKGIANTNTQAMVPSGEASLLLRAQMRITVGQVQVNQLANAQISLDSWFDPTSKSIDSLPIEVRIEAADTVASIYAALGKLRGAEFFAKLALDLREKTSTNQSYDLLVARMRYATALQSVGSFAQSASLYQSSLMQIKVIASPDDPNISLGMSNLASVFVRLSRPQEAQRLYQDAIAIESQRKQVNAALLVSMYENYQKLLTALGRVNEASKVNELTRNLRSKEGFVEASNGMISSSHELAGKLSNAVEILNAGDWESAKQKLTALLSESQVKLGEDHPMMGDINAYLGWLHLQQKSFKASEGFFQKSLDIRRSSLGAEHPEVISAFYNLGVLFDEQRQTSKAVQFFTEALVGLRTKSEPQLAWLVEYGMSRAMGRLNNVEAGLFWGWKALFSIQTMRRGIEGLGVETRSSFVADKLDVFNWVAELSIQTGRIEEAQGVVYLLKQEEFTDSDDSQPLPEFSDFASPAVKKLILRLESASKASANELKKFISEASELARTLKDPSGEGRTSSVRSSEDQLRGIIKGWRSQTAFVQYLVFRNESWAVVTTADGRVAQRLTLGSVNLQNLVINFRNQLQDTSIDPREMAQQLYWMLIGPIERTLAQAKVKRLMFSLDDSLRYLPMAALHDGNKYLIEKYGITLYTEGSREKLGLDPARNWSMAGFGVTKEHPGASALPAVRDEFMGIVDAGVMPGSYLLDEKFNLTTLQASLNGKANVLHIASHFKFDDKKADNSFLLLGDGTRLTLKMMKDLKLKLSNFDLLTLSACETGLGGGRNSKGKEVEGFAILGQKLGAKAVLATLWEVADESTAITMQTVYKNRREKDISTSDALQEAQLDLLRGTQKDASRAKLSNPVRKFFGEAESDSRAPTRFVEDTRKPFAHPFYWAPFILMGNPL